MKFKNLPLTCMLLVSVFMYTDSQAQNITTPRVPSPAAKVSQTVGISTVTVKYSRPSVRDREIWGNIVPFGYNNLGFGTATAAPWRAGANENTVIIFSDDAKIEGQDLKAGTYGLHIAVKENNEATIIFSNNSSSWGSFFYDEGEDALRVDVSTEEIPMTEVLTYDFIDLDKNSTTAVLDWEKKRFPFKVSFDTDQLVIANAKDELRGTTGFSWQGALSAANYCLQNNVNLDQGLAWADQSLQQSRNFQTISVKAGLLKQKDPNADVTALFDEAAKIANINQLNALGYQLMLQHNEVNKAIEYFKMNVERNPTDANVHDSLGEAYKTAGMDKLAIKSLKKSLSLNPPPNVKANSLKLLKELGVEDYAEAN